MGESQENQDGQDFEAEIKAISEEKSVWSGVTGGW